MVVDKEHSAPAGSEERANKEASSEEQVSGVPRWLAVTAVLALTGVAIVIIYGYLARPKPEWIGVANKNVWDWLKLLVVPAALAIGVYWLNTRQAARQQREEDRRQASVDAAQEAQAKQALALEDQRAQDEALQAYLDQMSQLLTDQDRPLHRAQPGDSLSTVARARTLTVLARLNGERKGSVVQFLYEAGLIIKDHTLVDLTGADLRGAYLHEARLHGADLRGADLRETRLVNADLIRANLSEADLSEADLKSADLRGADLSSTDLRGADLRGEADLSRANLSGANLSEADLRGESDLSSTDLSSTDLRKAMLRGAKLRFAKLRGADLRGGADLSGADLFRADLRETKLVNANLHGANLEWANLRGHNPREKTANLEWAKLSEANLRRADLMWANLRGANLSGANLSGANLSGAKLMQADLRGVIGKTNEELEVALSLKGATMPNGQMYKDWLRDKKIRAEDAANGENRDTS